MESVQTLSNSVVLPGNNSPPQQNQPHTPQGLSFDLENGFEPQTRARSNTWPLPRPDGYIDGNTASTNIGIDVVKEESEDCELQLQHGQLNTNGNHHNNIKKNSSRRNAWGNLSYADLITSAITSAADQRLTLSQIYEWMVQNVSYFMDKGDSNSSAGWKNSIRHNLSLHNRFMRVQNEGTGKSSWWMINPDAKPGKSARRRAASMETSKFEKRRGRAKKKVEAFKSGLLQTEAASSPSSSISEGIDHYADSPPIHSNCFQLSPEFRPRTSSNASSISRLSPIQAVPSEPDWPYNSAYTAEQLAGNLAETMKLESYGLYSPPSQQQSQPQQPPQQQQQPPPPSYYESQYQRSNSFSATSPYGLPPTPQSASQQRCTVPCQMNLSPASNLSMSPSYQSETSTSPLAPQQQQQQPQPPQSQPQQQQQHQNLHYVVDNHQRVQQQQQLLQRQAQTRLNNSSPPELLSGTPPVTVMGQLMGALNTNPTLLDDLNINIEGLSGEFDCNVDEVIKHELSMDGTLRCDFNFPQGIMGTSGVQISDAPINQSNDITLNNQIQTVPSNQQNGGVYVNSNTTTNAPAAPSWVH